MKKVLNVKSVFILLGPLIFGLFIIFNPIHAPLNANYMAGIVLWMAVWWLSECVHLAVTSLLPIVLVPLCQIAPVKEVAAQYGDSIIFLFLGGFLISIAIEKWDLHKRIARHILQITGNTISGILIGIMISTFVVSNWISNTATALMFFGVIMSLIKETDTNMQDKDKKFLSVSLLLGMAYAASIGGMATPVGTPPNMYFFKIYPKIFGEAMQVSFIDWLRFFYPLSMVILIGCYFILKLLFLNKMSVRKINIRHMDLNKKYAFTYEEKIISLVFLITVILWFTRENMTINNFQLKGWKNLFHQSGYFDDAVVAIASALLLFIIPSKKNKGESILIWEDVKQLKYEILLLFGGGFALAYGFEKSGLIVYLVEQLKFVRYFHPLLIIFFISVIVVIISEFASNIASIQLALPVIGAMIIHFPKAQWMPLIFPCVLSASVGFMLPVATAPNTIAFGSGEIPLKKMLLAGFFLDIFSIFAISIYSYFVL